MYTKGDCKVDPAIAQAGDIDTSLVVLKFANGVIGTISNSRKVCDCGWMDGWMDSHLLLLGSLCVCVVFVVGVVDRSIIDRAPPRLPQPQPPERSHH